MAKCIDHPKGEPFIFIEKWEVDLCGGQSAEAQIVSCLRKYHIQAPEHMTPVSWQTFERELTCYDRKSLASALQSLKSKGLLVSHVYTAESAACTLKAKTPQHLAIGRLTCSWCKSTTVINHDHHYPVPSAKGGDKTVSICCACHEEFHFLVDNTFYLPSMRLISEFESHPAPSELLELMGV